MEEIKFRIKTLFENMYHAKAVNIIAIKNIAPNIYDVKMRVEYYNKYNVLTNEYDYRRLYFSGIELIKVGEKNVEAVNTFIQYKYPVNPRYV
jgi:hypothetical protein